MRVSHPCCPALIAALLGGCSAVQPPTVNGSAARAALVLPAKGRNLLYASTAGDKPVYVYTFPQGKELGLLTGPSGPRGLCVDKLGDIFVPWVYTIGGIYEYAHGGGTPIASLGLEYDWPNSCSVNPHTGALAVVAGPSHGSAAIELYRYNRKRGWGFSQGYYISVLATSDFCGYDATGNLFVDGKDRSGNFGLAELPSGGKTFVKVSVAQGISTPGQIQWDGAHVAIGDSGVSPSVIYQFDISDKYATEVGSTTLIDSQTLEQFWIQGGNVVAPDSTRKCGASQGGCIAIYNYPAGGNAVKTISLPGAFGATVSLAQ